MGNLSKRKDLIKLDRIMTLIKDWWLIVVVLLIIFTLAGMFILSFIYSKDKEVTLDLVNSWVSLILGIVATLLSIISMFLSFYNLERTNEINEDSLDSMKELQKNVEATLQKIIEIEKVVGKKSLSTGTEVAYDNIVGMDNGFERRDQERK
ncbi:hypothetical protein [Kurthia sp. Dielmo]|uniref:hypothetical protein n=1 Tax=Kurthia sp. Dielmo TaxID=1033738 RepID=UPI0005CC14D2|nr:hypothetical protein [Kurthia sp. Dielmo]